MKRAKKLWWTCCVVAVLLGGGYFTSCSDDEETVVTDAMLDALEMEDGALSHGDLTSSRATGELTTATTAGTITVTVNGEEKYSDTKIDEAWDKVKDVSSGTVVVTLAPGKYEPTAGKLTYSGAASITIKGTGTKDYGLDVLIEGQGSNMEKESTRSLLSFGKTAQVVLQNITLRNSHWNTTGDAQSETIGVTSNSFTGTLAAYNCSFLSGQDTICTEGKAWFYKCYIQGDVDFLWMETKGGVVALYEECVIRAINARAKSAYFTAPRLAIADTVGKGLVIFNSTLEVEDGVDAYLGRNPWSGESTLKSYYEQVAIVGTKLYGKLNAAIWKSPANGTADQRYVGYKTDDNFPASTSGYGTRIGKSILPEYSNRDVILNRHISLKSIPAFEDDESKWDVAKVMEDNGWE